MMKKIIKSFSILVICLFSLAVFGWMSVHLSRGDKDFGFLNEPIKFMYSFLDQFNASVEEVKTMSPTFMPIWEEIDSINNLQFDLNVLMSYSESDNIRTVVIKNLKNDSILYKWNISEKVTEYDRIVNPISFPNKDLIYSFTDVSGLRRMDSLGNIKWKQDSIVSHHSLNLDSAGNIWVCTKIPPPKSASGTYKINNRVVYYDDDYITLIDANSGKILFNKSISNILKENSLSSYLLQAQTVSDPIHLNDIQPALKTTTYYNEGDVFLSIKQSSMIVHYRPSTNKVINVIEGPFSAQHDVDFLHDTTLTIFNNNTYPWWTTETLEAPDYNENLVVAGDFYSNIIQYNFRTNKFSFIGDSLFRANKLFTSTEGLHEYINDSTYFVEQQNVGYLWVIQNDKVVYKNLFKSPHEGYCHLPNWTRIIN